MSDRTAIRMGGQRSSGLLTTVAVPAPRDRAGRRRAPDRAAVTTTSTWPASPGSSTGTELEAARRRARRAPAGPQRAPRPGRRASRRRGSRPGRAAGPPARRGRAGPRRHARSRTARRRDAPGRGRGPRRGPRRPRRCDGARTLGPAATGTTAATAVSRKRAFLPVDSTSSARRAGRAIARGRPGRPPPEPRSTNASMPSGAKERHGRQAVEDVRDGDLARVADGGQVDRRGPGEEQPDVAVDGGPLRGGEDQAEPVEPGVEGVVVRGGERWEALDARRERLTRGLQGTPPVSRADRPAPCHSRRHRFAPRA